MKKILAIEPYYAGSHKAFIDGLIDNSAHNWTLLTLPGYKWKWRMRHSAVTFAGMVNDIADNFDVIFTSDMLNLAEFKGLLKSEIASLPTVVYFHENQLTYPSRFPDERDYQFAMTNMTTALAADKVWFNSQFHKTEFLDALRKLLKKMPDYQMLDEIAKIDKNSLIYPPGVNIQTHPKSPRPKGPLKILWAGRWEHDKNPEDFFAAIKKIKAKGCDFRLNILGEQFRDSPQIFELAKTEFAEHIDNWGFLPSFSDYQKVLADSDVFVSTAVHEFFGIAFVEAVVAGVLPIVPKRLAYPEILRNACCDRADDFLYDGSVKELTQRLQKLCYEAESNHDLWEGLPNLPQTLQKYQWKNHAKTADELLKSLSCS